MKSENVLSLFIELSECKRDISLHEISLDYSISERTAKDYIKSIRNVLAEQKDTSKSLIYDRSLKKYLIR